MHPVYNSGRRKARVQHLHRKYSSATDARYTDIAQTPPYPRSTLAVTDNEGTVINAATFLHLSPTAAEATAIALAAATHTPTTHVTIITDSQQACRHYLLGRVPRRHSRSSKPFPTYLQSPSYGPRDMPHSLGMKQHMLRPASFTSGRSLQGQAARPLRRPLSILFPLLHRHTIALPPHSPKVSPASPYPLRRRITNLAPTTNRHIL